MEKFDNDRLNRTIGILRSCLEILSLAASTTFSEMRVFACPDSESQEPSNAPSQSSSRYCSDSEDTFDGFSIAGYEGKYLKDIRELMDVNLSERYNIYVYRSFVDSWPDFSFVAKDDESKKLVGALIGKGDDFSGIAYLAMLAVDEEYRKKGIGKALIKRFIKTARIMGYTSVNLETEVDNEAALHIYTRLGFYKELHHFNYYINGSDAFALTLPLYPTDVHNLSLSSQESNNDLDVINEQFQQIYI